MSLPEKSHLMKAMSGRTRTMSECSEDGKDKEVKDLKVAYDVDGKFTYSSAGHVAWRGMEKTAVDVDGKFTYFSADMRPVPPGWYNVDKSKHMVPIGWYDRDHKI